MSWDVARRALDIALEQPIKDPPPLVSFFGGEPLLQFPLIKRCVSYVESHGAAPAALFEVRCFAD